MEFVGLAVIVAVIFYFLCRSPRCPNCGGVMVRRSTSNWMSNIDDRWVCDRCSQRHINE